MRINHHRNCLLCHAPLEPKANVSTEKAATLETLAVQVPMPDQELRSPSSSSRGYYEKSNPDILVRVDVTYLRQDFSVKLPVADPGPWPEMQRFDFLVRTRPVSELEAQAYRDLLRAAPAWRAVAVSPGCSVRAAGNDRSGHRTDGPGVAKTTRGNARQVKCC